MKKKKYKTKPEVEITEIISKLLAKIERKKGLLTIIEHRIQKEKNEIEKKKKSGANTKRQEKEMCVDKKAAHSVRQTIRKTKRTIEKIKKAHPTHKKDNYQPKCLKKEIT